MRATRRLLELTSVAALTGLLFSPALAEIPESSGSWGASPKTGQALGAAGQAIGGEVGQALGAAGKAFGGTPAPAGAETANQPNSASSQSPGAMNGQPSTATADKPTDNKMARDDLGSAAIDEPARAGSVGDRPVASKPAPEPMRGPVAPGASTSQTYGAVSKSTPGATSMAKADQAIEESGTPYSAESAPYGASSTPYGASSAPYGASSAPYGASSAPYGAGAATATKGQMPPRSEAPIAADVFPEAN